MDTVLQVCDDKKGIPQFSVIFVNSDILGLGNMNGQTLLEL